MHGACSLAWCSPSVPALWLSRGSRLFRCSWPAPLPPASLLSPALLLQSTPLLSPAPPLWSTLPFSPFWFALPLMLTAALVCTAALATITHIAASLVCSHFSHNFLFFLCFTYASFTLANEESRTCEWRVSKGLRTCEYLAWRGA